MTKDLEKLADDLAKAEGAVFDAQVGQSEARERYRTASESLKAAQTAYHKACNELVVQKGGLLLNRFESCGTIG